MVIYVAFSCIAKLISFNGDKLVDVVVGHISEKGLTLDNEMNVLSPDGTVHARMIVR